MADALARLKSIRATALAWLRRHPCAAARALVPAALDKPGRPRRDAEGALRALATAGHRADVVDAARVYGPEVAAAIEAFLSSDPLTLLPTRIPTLPDWIEPRLFPLVLLRDRVHALPPEALRHLCTMLVISKPEEVYAGLEMVTAACDPESLAEFGWTLFRQWQVAGAPPKESWVIDALGWIGDDETVRRLAPLIRSWPAEPGQQPRAVQALDVLVTIGSDVALMHLHGISQKVRFKGLRDRATTKITQIATERGLSAEELADRLVPDLGLDGGGGLTLDYGARRFLVGFDEHLKPYVADEDGTPRKELPKPGTRDDQTLAPAAYKRFAALKKDVRAVADDQIHRLEQAMLTQRRWTGKQFRELFIEHPLLWHLVRRLVWASFDSDGTVATALRVAEDRTFTDIHDEIVTLDQDATIGIPHPLHLDPLHLDRATGAGDGATGTGTLAAWSELFADYQILQPFPQLARDVYRFADHERDTYTLQRLHGHTVPTSKLLGRAWVPQVTADAGIQGQVHRDLPGGCSIVVELSPGLVAGGAKEALEWHPEQQLMVVWISSRPGGQGESMRLGDVDPLPASEALLHLHELSSGAA
jgi:hypothetical protein